jgi:hypothetical protein
MNIKPIYNHRIGIYNQQTVQARVISQNTSATTSYLYEFEEKIKESRS